MKMVKGLSFIVVATLLSACNEQVSPELQQSGATSTAGSGSGGGAPSEYYFRVVDSSAPVLNYKVHKTGAGNATTSCAVTSTSALSSDNYRGDPASNDITCYYDAEELSLLHAGFKFKVESSKNTCDFVAYSPYGFFDRIPGDSSGTYTQIRCTNDTTTNADVVTAAAAAGIDISTSATDLGCGDWASNDIVSTTRKKFPTPPATDADLCRFNYKTGSKERCDVGVVKVNRFDVTFTPGTPAGTLKYELVTREIECGGTIANCVQGPVKKMGTTGTDYISIGQTQTDKDYSTEYSYEGQYQKKVSNRSYINFRRNLASTEIDYGTSVGLGGGYLTSWSNTLYGKVFDPRVMDYYSNNLMIDNMTPLIDDTRLAAEAARNDTWLAKPLAADPIMGLDPSSRVNPFYTFYCFDTAYDIKARIRMVVREWDRVFPTNGDIEYLSDLFRGSASRQDSPNYVEVPNSTDSSTRFNDLFDWDDRIDMVRSPGGGFDPTMTIWQPAPTGAYADGWFNPDIFTNNNL